MPELLENQTGDLAKGGAKKRIHKIPAHHETFTDSSVQKKKLCVPKEAQFSNRLGMTGYPMTFRASPTLPLSLH
jgi:hypothetical protein